MNKSGITKTSYVSQNQILFSTDFQFSVGVVVSNAAFVVDGSKKVVKAGTPLVGNLDARTTPFTVGLLATAATVKGVLLHDVDVTNGNANGTLLIQGYVNTNKLDAVTKALLIAEIKTALNAKVTFIAG